MKKRKIGCLPVLMFLCIAVILFISGIYVAEDRKFEKVKEEVIQEDEKKEDGMKINWDKLPDDCIAWIHFKHPKKIDYPIMQSTDNSYYLHRDIDGEYSYAGSIFEDFHNDPAFTDENTIVYGHNMANNTMFGSLKKFKDEDYLKKNNKFYIYTRTGHRYTYRIYNVLIVSPSSKIYVYKFGSEELKAEYIKEWTVSESETKSMPTVEDKLVTLSTCQYSGTKRLIVQGYMIEDKEYES